MEKHKKSSTNAQKKTKMVKKLKKCQTKKLKKGQTMTKNMNNSGKKA